MREGELELDSYCSKDYYVPSSVNDILKAIVNLQAVYKQLWAYDWRPQIILRVAIKYDFFSKCKVS